MLFSDHFIILAFRHNKHGNSLGMLLRICICVCLLPGHCRLHFLGSVREYQCPRITIQQCNSEQAVSTRPSIHRWEGDWVLAASLFLLVAWCSGPLLQSLVEDKEASAS